MAGNGGGSSSSRAGGGASIGAAAAAAGSTETRFPPPERRRKWGGCFGGLSCFGSQKRGKRVVPASRIPDGNASANRGNGPQSVGNSNQNSTLIPSLLAPPSSPASFTNSALPSTAQSPSCFLSISANSPGGPSSTMFATGPYAHETQLVTPPVFSTYTTEPSTAPLTPPPELAHPTTPSSPDVPFARFLSSSLDLKNAGKANGMPFMPSSYVPGGDLQATYPLYPGSPSSSLISPASATPRTGLSSPFAERETPVQWGTSISAHDSPYSINASSKLFGLDPATSRNFMLSPHSSFFCPATSAQFYLDQAQQSCPYAHCGGRLSVSREADIYSSGGNRHSKACKQDVEEIEAYRASFGFSADEIISTQNYVEISDVADDSFTMSPFPNSNPCIAKCSMVCPASELANGAENMKSSKASPLDPVSPNLVKNQVDNGVGNEEPDLTNACTGSKSKSQSEVAPLSLDDSAAIDNLDERFSRISAYRVSNRIRSGQSCSDAEIDYRRARSLRDAKNMFV